MTQYYWVWPNPVGVASGDKRRRSALSRASINDLQGQLSVAPTNSDLRWQLAREYVAIHDYSAATQQYHMLLHQRPEFHEARLELAVLLSSTHPWDAVLSHLTYLVSIQKLR